jgi:hypothetical protein
MAKKEFFYQINFKYDIILPSYIDRGDLGDG